MTTSTDMSTVDLSNLDVTAVEISKKDRQRIEGLIENEELRGHAMQGMALQAQARAQGLVYRFALGRIMMDAVRNMKSSVPIKTLGEAWQLDQDQTYHIARFAERYTMAEFRTLMNTGLSWSHVRILVNVDDKKARLGLQKTAVTDKMGYRDLSKAAQVLLGSRSNNPSGRKTAIPRTISGGVTKMRTMSQAWLRTDADVFGPHVLAELAQLGADNITPELVADVEGLAADLRQLAENTQNDAELAKEQVARLVAALAATQAAAEEADDGVVAPAKAAAKAKGKGKGKAAATAKAAKPSKTEPARQPRPPRAGAAKAATPAKIAAKSGSSVISDLKGSLLGRKW
jgi:hypothetical protein